MTENTTTKRPALRSEVSDELGSLVLDTLETQREAGYARGAWINSAAPIGGEADAVMHRASTERQQLHEAQVGKMWRAFYDYAGGVGQLRSQLFELLDWIGGVDTEDAGDLALQAYERLLTVVQDSFGDGAL